MMKSAGAFVLWIVLVALGAFGLEDAVQSIPSPQVRLACLIAYAAGMLGFFGYLLIRYRQVHWPSLYIAVAVASGLVGLLLLSRPDSVPNGSAFLAMGVSIFVGCLLRRPRRS